MFAGVALGSTTQVNVSPYSRAAMASAIPKFPELLSTRWAPGGIEPSARPFSMR
jgi:hypothetical protein